MLFFILFSLLYVGFMSFLPQWLLQDARKTPVIPSFPPKAGLAGAPGASAQSPAVMAASMFDTVLAALDPTAMAMRFRKWPASTCRPASPLAQQWPQEYWLTFQVRAMWLSYLFVNFNDTIQSKLDPSNQESVRSKTRDPTGGLDLSSRDVPSRMSRDVPGF